jgi:hypothetical protein
MSINIRLIDRGRDWDAIQPLVAKPHGSTPGSLASLEKEFSSNSECYVAKAVDTNTDGIVGISV